MLHLFDTPQFPISTLSRLYLIATGLDSHNGGSHMENLWGREGFMTSNEWQEAIGEMYIELQKKHPTDYSHCDRHFTVNSPPPP